MTEKQAGKSLNDLINDILEDGYIIQMFETTHRRAINISMSGYGIYNREVFDSVPDLNSADDELYDVLKCMWEKNNAIRKEKDGRCFAAMA